VERIERDLVYDGKFSSVTVEEFRYDDGDTATREIVHHPGAVGMVAYDDEVVWMVRQPRAGGGGGSLLELPAGKLDKEGEPPLECAKRELFEEVGLEAESWEAVKSFWMTPGWADEEHHLFAATGLRHVGEEPTEGERIEIVRWPLADLGGAIAECSDAKSIVGLLWLDQRLR